MAYCSVSGWTQAPGVVLKRVLRGHRQLLLELDALYVGHRLLQQAVDRCEAEGLVALKEEGLGAWQRSTLRHQVLRGALPPKGQKRDVAFWGVVLDTARDEVKTRQQRIKLD